MISPCAVDVEVCGLDLGAVLHKWSCLQRWTSFTKAIDVWMATCLVFVFGSFIEYSVVNVLADPTDHASQLDFSRCPPHRRAQGRELSTQPVLCGQRACSPREDEPAAAAAAASDGQHS